MSNELTDKIKDFFNSIDCKPDYILKTPKAGETVDNRCGIEFELPEYAVIFSGNVTKENKYKKIYEFEEKEKTNFLLLNKEYCNLEGLLEELGQIDDYQIIYNSKENKDNSNGILQSLIGEYD